MLRESIIIPGLTFRYGSARESTHERALTVIYTVLLKRCVRMLSPISAECRNTYRSQQSEQPNIVIENIRYIDSHTVDTRCRTRRLSFWCISLSLWDTNSPGVFRITSLYFIYRALCAVAPLLAYLRSRLCLWCVESSFKVCLRYMSEECLSLSVRRGQEIT